MCPMGAHFILQEKTMELKRATTFDEQAELLQKKGIIINDIHSCKEFLSRVNYYRLSGYYLPFIKKDETQCFIPICFERIQNIYTFDAELRNLISFVIERIEVHIRTQLAYYHAHKYGSEGYIKPSSFNKKHNHSTYLKHVKSCISENSNTLVVKHHIAHYDGHFPIWAIIEFFSIGMLSYFYNRCAHYSRIYYWIFSATPKMPTHEKYIPTRRLFAQLYMLKMMYPEKDKWNDEFLKPLIKLVKKYKKDISLKHLDFPYRWKSMLKQK